MNYKSILNEGEKPLHISRLHIFVMSYPLVFSGVFGTTFTIGGMFTPEFRIICYIMTVIFAIYPITIIILLFKTKWVITNLRVIEQTGIFVNKFQFVKLNEIKKVSFNQTNFGKKIRCGDVRLKVINPKGKTYYKVFKYMTKPHMFIVQLQDAMKGNHRGNREKILKQ